MAPLAERMRPKKLSDFIGQEHLIAEGKPLYNAIQKGRIHSMIFWGPPGVGKTTLAQIIAEQSGRPFFMLSAIHAGVKDIRDAIEKAEKQQFFDSPTPLLFIDEIHRFSKSQQDALLGAVEKGILTLIGATTENPSFEVIPALLSRSQVYVLHALEIEDLTKMVHKALSEDTLLKTREVELKELDALMVFSGGDGRKLYNTLEIVADAFPESEKIVLDNQHVKKILQERITLYDKSGEQHYDVISAFIKSIRGSDPNAAVYYLAKMLHAGESIEFIARRLIILAAEDIGLANPNALLMAQTCFDSIRVIGLPEARIILSQTCIYLATSPKSNAAYLAIDKALAHIKHHSDEPIPMHLRNAPTQLMKKLNYGQNYKYAHDHPGHFAEQEFLPENIAGLTFYEPANNPAEVKHRAYLKMCWKEKYGY